MEKNSRSDFIKMILGSWCGFPLDVEIGDLCSHQTMVVSSVKKVIVGNNEKVPDQKIFPGDNDSFLID
jgi:hypothetical protein